VLPDTVVPAEAAGAAIGKDGKLYPIPMEVREADGKTVIILHADHYGTFAIVKHTATFTDISGSWAREAIQRLGNRMIVAGYPDDSFRPEVSVTRAEFSAILARTLGLQADVSKPAGFAHVSDDNWFGSYAAVLASAGILTGYEDGTFSGDQTITREEAAMLLSRAMEYVKTGDRSGMEGERESFEAFTDCEQIQAYALDAIDNVRWNRVIDGYEDGSFRPGRLMNRAETVTMVSKLLQYFGF
jgi:hypothetical protein